MQIANARYIALTLLLLLGTALYVAMGDSHMAPELRWPGANELYMVDNWSVSGEQLAPASNNTQQVTRVYSDPRGQQAVLTLFAQRIPKLYGAGPEVPFLGSGYTVVGASSEMLRFRNEGIGALVAQQASEQWLVMYAYGERRGLLGNGPVPWSLAILDDVLGRPNDYYKVYLATRADQDQAASELGAELADLAHTVFPRIAAWYAA